MGGSHSLPVGHSKHPFRLVDHPCLPPQIEHLYGLTVFENYLYATNSDNANTQQKTSVIRVNRFNSTEYQVVTRVDKGGALHIYHQRRQPRGTRVQGPLLSGLHPDGTPSSGPQFFIVFIARVLLGPRPQAPKPGFCSHGYPYPSTPPSSLVPEAKL